MTVVSFLLAVPVLLLAGGVGMGAWLAERFRQPSDLDRYADDALGLFDDEKRRDDR